MEGRYIHIVYVLLCCLICLIQCELRASLNGTLVSARLKSGPVFLIDSRTILVTRFSYDNGKLKNLQKIHNKWFKGVVRRGDNVTEYVDLEFRNGTTAQLTANLYLAQNLYLHLPDRQLYTVRELSAVAIINHKNRTKTSVEITPFDLEKLPDTDDEYEYTKNNSFVFVYPKCCPLSDYCKDAKCLKGPPPHVKSVERFPVHEKRMMKYNTESMPTTAIHYEPFYLHQPCASNQMFDISDSDVVLLSNNELLMSDISRPQLACMENSLDDDGVLREKVFICLEDAGLDDKALREFFSSGWTIQPQSLGVLLLYIAIIVQIN